MTLSDYVVQHAVRGACKCGRCIDAGAHPELQQPEGHVVDLTFFKVGADGGTRDEMLALVKAEFPDWLDGKEHGYMEIGGAMGDQGLALMTIGLGHVLKVWEAFCPETMMPFMPAEVKMQMAGRGMVTLKFSNASDKGA